MKPLFRWLLLMSICGPAISAEYPARVQWAERLTLSTPSTGVVTQVAVQPGQRVAEGDLLLALDPRPGAAALKRAKAVLEEARQNNEEAKRELERTQELFDRTLLSIHDLQVAQIEAVGAAARLGQAEAELVEARLQQEYSRLRSPYDAWVVALPAQTGQTVVNRCQAQALAVLAPAGRMAAQAWLDPQQIAALAIGDPVRVKVDEETFAGKVSLLGLEPDRDPGQVLRYRLEVQFDLPDERLMRPGQSALILTTD